MTGLVVLSFAVFSLAVYLMVLRPSLERLAVAGLRDASQPLLRGLQADFGVHEHALAGALHLAYQAAGAPFGEAHVRALNHGLIPMLVANPGVAAVILADDDGRSYLLLRNDDGSWSNRIADPVAWGRRTRHLLWRDLRAPLTDTWRETGYDSRARPWYRGALAGGEGRRHWTAPYIFFASGQPGITVSQAWRDRDGRRYVIAMDILLKTVSAQAQALTVGASGSAALLGAAGEVVGLPRELSRAATAALPAATAFPGSGLGQAYRDWQRLGQPAGRPFRIDLGGEDWLAEFQPLDLGATRFWVVTYAPKRDFAPWSVSMPAQMLAVLLLVMLLAMAFAAWLARRLSQPVEDLATAAGALADGRMEARVRIRGALEIRRLSDAFNRMAERLAAREADLARQGEALRRLNEELEERVERRTAVLAALFDTLPYPVFVKGEDTVFTACNRAYEEAFGVRREEFIGKRVLDLAFLPEAERAAFQAEDEAIIAGHGSTRREIDIVFADASLHRVIYTITSFQLADGTPAGMLGVLFDITERHRAEARLREITDDLPGAVFQLRETSDRVRHLDFISAGVERLFGVPQAQAQDAFARLYDLVLAEDRDTIEAAFRHSADNLARLLVNFRVRTATGRVGWVHCEASPHRREDGSIVWNGSLADLTAEKETEAALAEARLAAEEANRAKSAFLANMSHEIRTPMNAILGMTHLALAAEPERRQRGYLDKIDAAARALLRIVDDILDFSKIEAGKLAIENTPFQLGNVLDHLADLLGAKAQEKGLELLFQVEPGLASETLLGDPLRLGQVLLNLVGNAIKFTATGEIVVEVGRGAEVDDRLEVAFRVRDTGIGIAPEHQARLFQPFEQADSSITRRFGGTGLGLAICRRLVGLMGGRLEVASQLDQGSEFNFTVVLARGAGSADAVPAPGLIGKRILVVDDNPAARAILQGQLESLRFEVGTAASGAHALAEIEAAAERGAPYDAVLLDWTMPGVNGIEAARLIRADALTVAPPKLILVTGQAGVALGEEARAVALDGFLAKPITPSSLFDCLMAVFLGQPSSRHRAGASTAQSAPALRGLRILLVEDNEVNQDVGAEILGHAGMVVDIAGNGQEALARLAGRRYDAVLMDIQMPVMDGYEATRRIRQDPTLAGLPVIAMTASVLPEDRARCLDAGMSDFVAKPIDVDALLATLARWLGGSQTAERVPAVPAVPAELAGIAGLDVADGLKRVGGKAQAYCQLLDKFRRRHAGCDAEIRAAWQRGDRQAAQERLHALKGVSGNLGATALFESTCALQAAMTTGTATEVEAGLDRLRDQLAGLVAALADALAALAPVPGTRPAGDFATAWSVLTGLVDDCDADALPALRQARAVSPLPDGALWLEAERRLERYDFEGAAASLARLAESMADGKEMK